MNEANAPSPLYLIRPHLAQMSKHNACGVYLALRGRLNSKTGRCDPGNETIAADLGMDVRTVKKAKRLLRTLGVLDWVERPGRSDQHLFPQPPSSHAGGQAEQPPSRNEGGHPVQGATSAPLPPSSGAGDPPHFVQQPPSWDAPRSIRSDAGEEFRAGARGAAGAAGGVTAAVLAASVTSQADEDFEEYPQSPIPYAAAASHPEPSATPAPLPPEPEKRTGGKRPKTRIDVAAIIASHDSLTAYLLSGQFNWTGHVEENRANAEKWTVPQWAGFYWWNVSKYRHDRNMQQSLPAWDRLSGDLANLLKQMTANQLLVYVQTVVGYFDIIKWMCGHKMAQGMVLDHTTLSNSIVSTKAKAIMEMGEFKLQGVIEQYKASFNGGFGAAA